MLDILKRPMSNRPSPSVGAGGGQRKYSLPSDMKGAKDFSAGWVRSKGSRYRSFMVDLNGGVDTTASPHRAQSTVPRLA